MSSLSFKFQPSPPSDRFWWGVVVLVLLVVTGVKQSQLLVLRLNLEFDKNYICCYDQLGCNRHNIRTNFVVTL